MAKQSLFAIAIVAVALPAVTFATEFLVGDTDGWSPDYDYEGWAKGKEFRVGDTLVFKYSPESHTVYQVDENGYKECNIPSTIEGLTSGEDKITLDSPGPKYFVCGIGLHCLKGGQKLAIVVKGGPQGPTNKPKTAAPSPAPVVGSPNVAPSHAPISNDSPAPGDSDADDYPSDELASPPVVDSVVSPPPKSNGVQRMEYTVPMVVATAIVALVNVL